ncbi:MAG: hypothetical protein WCS94_09035, partial [Verrucomicrobiota bacterium]
RCFSEPKAHRYIFDGNALDHQFLTILYCDYANAQIGLSAPFAACPCFIIIPKPVFVELSQKDIILAQFILWHGGASVAIISPINPKPGDLLDYLAFTK